MISLRAAVATTILVALFFTNSQPVGAQYQADYSMGQEFQVSNKYLVVGDRIDVTLKVTDKDGKPITIDRKARFTIRNPKQGQTCETTDDNYKDDGLIKGWCEAKSEAGNMEIAVSIDDQNTFTVNDTRYSPYIYKTYNAMFNDPNQTCQDANLPPTNVTILKQNDVTVDVKWQHSETFVGSYHVLYGTTAGEYNGKKVTEQRNVVIDSLDAAKPYYFKVQAISACKTTTSSPVYMYTPSSGSVVLSSEKITSSPSPKPSVSPTPRATASARTSPSPTATVAATPAPADEVVGEVVTSPSPSPTSEPEAFSVKNLPIELKIILGGLAVGLIPLGIAAFQQLKKRRPTASTVVEESTPSAEKTPETED